MDLLTMRVPLLLLTALSGCSGTGLLPEEITSVRGRNASFPVTISSEFSVISMSYKKTSDSTAPMFTYNPPNPLKVAPEYAGRIFFNNSTYEVKLGPLTQADSGVYTILVMDKNYFPLSEDATLVVLEPVADVVILSNLPEAVEFNDTVTLTCSAKGSSLAYKWLNGSVPIVADGKHLVFNASQLIITGVLRTDLRGPIFCTAENKMESLTSSAFNQSVNYGPESVVMKKLPDSSVLKKGSNLTLSCSAVSSPAAELKWLLNGAELPQKEATLTLTNLAEKQSGNYSCLAYNSKTKRSAVSQVATVSVIESISGTYITASSSFLIAGNSTVNLTCRASVGKADSVSWFKEEKPLVGTDRITFTAEKNTITFVKVQKEDAGVYKCQLTNKVNSDSSSYKMDIAYGPEKAILSGPTKVEVGTNIVVLKCEAASVPPATYVWKLNDTLLVGESAAEYKIEKPDYKNTGKYTCEARNSVTGLIQTDSRSLTVKGQGELNDQLSDGAIAAIVIAVLVVVAIIIAVIVRKRRKHSDIPSPY